MANGDTQYNQADAPANNCWRATILVFVFFCGLDASCRAHVADKTTMPEFLVRSSDNPESVGLTQREEGCLWLQNSRAQNSWELRQ